MSWTQQQGPPLQQQQYPPTSSPAVVAGAAHNSTSNFAPQQWQPQTQKQPQNYLQQNQHQNSMQQPSPNQNNWFNPALQPASNQFQYHQEQQNQNNWQQQQLQSIPQSTNSSYFMKQQPQQQTNASPQLDNFMQQSQIHQNSIQHQSLPNYPMQQQQQQHPNQNIHQSSLSNLPPPPTPAVNDLSNNYIKFGEEMPKSTQKAFDFYDNQQQSHQTQKQPQLGNGNNNEDWDDDWEWNDNQQKQPQQSIQLPPSKLPPQSQQQSNIFNPNSIEESFKIEPNDNWQWSMDASKGASLLESKHNILETKNYEVPSSFEINSKVENRRQSLENSVPAYNPENNSVNSSVISNSRNFQSFDTTSANSLENSQNLTGSAVYVSQAKPVSQPSRQYASPPSGIVENSSSMPSPPPPTITSNNSSVLTYPISSQSPGLTNVPPPPASHTPPQSDSLPPPPLLVQGKGGPTNNPFKRSGMPQHHRGTGVVTTTKISVQSPIVMSSQMPIQQQLHQQPFFAPPPPSEEFQMVQTTSSVSPGNQEIPMPENSEVIAERQFENLEIAPSNDRNQYLQTSHLSEDSFIGSNIGVNSINNRIEGIGGQNNDNDNFPPPGLSRLVLGQPEISNQNSSIREIPPGLDRMIPGTELVSSSSINLEREADGQDTIPSPRSAFTNVPPIEENDSSANIDITDRNLYLVPGESEHYDQPLQPNLQQQSHRVVTGFEDILSQMNQSSGEQREVELDGENLEDEQQPQPNHIGFDQNEIDLSTRDEPIEGANISDTQKVLIQVQNTNTNSNNNNNETESSLTIESHQKDLSNPSTGNDESDCRNNFVKQASRRNGAGTEEKMKKRNGGSTSANKENNEKKNERYESEESDISIERDRRRYREGSIRKERSEDKDYRGSKEKDRREKRETGSTKYRSNARDERTRYVRDEHERSQGRENKKTDRGRRDRCEKYDKNERDRPRYGTRYETDSKYETEGSRYERNRKDGSDRERDRDHYDDYYRDDKDNRKYRRAIGERNTDERRSDRRRDGDRERNDYNDERTDRSERHRIRTDKNRPEYDDDYRKNVNGSRNERHSDREKDRSVRNVEKDSRYSQIYGYSTNYNYDAYAYYQQQQQYYEQLRRTNPQAYAEWYRKYYAGQIQPDMSLTTTDGRESVHSGRSSANNDKDRYSLHHQQYIPHHTSDYHRNFLQQSNVSSTPNSSMIVEQQQQQQTFHPHLSGVGQSLSSVNLLQQQQQYQLNNVHGGYLIGENSSLRSYYAQSEYSESRPENASLNLIGDGASSINPEPQRLTPFKYTNEHSSVSMSAGLLVCVKPKYSQNGITNIVKILRLGSNDSTRRLFQTFPGPLIRGLTHKKTIIEFCEDQIRLGPPSSMRSRQNSMSSLCSVNQAHKASFTLMWNLLILLLRQNGMVVGTDIAELLMKNKNQFSYDSSNNQIISTKLGNSNEIATEIIDSNALRKDKSDDENHDTESLNSEVQQKNLSDDNGDTQKKSPLTEQEITEKFRNYLLYGNVNEALEWATDNNLWGHALFLASKVDRRSHANVMMKFANKLQLNDPLQTLYQLMSGRTPSSVTSVQDEKWGDWRPHLAMILSNTSQRPDLDRKAITTLGDSLYNRGDLYAAQFCYLMAQVGFGKYSAVNQNETTFMANSHNNTVRLILLGSSHHKLFREFATNEAIMMTEIYEYACALNDDKFSIVEFQPYKYLLATRMLDYGYQLKTLMYMEQISLHLQRDSSKYEPTFIDKIYTLADRLKYFDPVLEKTMDDQQNIENSSIGDNSVSQQTIEDQKWLQDLKSILSEHKPNFPQEIGYQKEIFVGSAPGYDTTIDQNRAAIDQQFVEINQQFSKLTMQYNNFDPMQQTLNQQPGETQQQIIDSGNQEIHQQTQQPLQQQSQYPQFYNPNEVSKNQIQIMGNEALNLGGGYNGNSYMQPQQPVQSFDQQQDILNIGGQGNYEYWDQSQQTAAQNEVPRPTISLPNSKQSAQSGYYDNDDNRTKTQSQKPATAPVQQKGNKNDNKISNKSGNISVASQNSGWFGGIWNKLSLKPKNQMILPDDKNPAIVWDSEKKKWVNTDGEVDEQENFKPPPKMSDINGTIEPPNINNYNAALQQQQQQQQQQQPFLSQPPEQQIPIYDQQQQQQIPLMTTGQPQQFSSLNQNFNLKPTNEISTPINSTPIISNVTANVAPISEPTKTPNLQSNMFKMQRNRTLKKSYVDVFNPSGAPSKPIEPVLAPAIPSAIPQSGFFIPSTTNVDNNSSQQQDGTPNFYNPNQFDGYQ